MSPLRGTRTPNTYVFIFVLDGGSYGSPATTGPSGPRWRRFSRVFLERSKWRGLSARLRWWKKKEKEREKDRERRNRGEARIFGNIVLPRWVLTGTNWAATNLGNVTRDSLHAYIKKYVKRGLHRVFFRGGLFPLMPGVVSSACE